ncbi:MAG: class I SAM-dependent methyltransferase [Nocardioides sp.]
MTLTEPTRPDRPAGSPIGRWPGLFDVPSGPAVAVAAAVTRRIFAMATGRLGVRVLSPAEASQMHADTSQRRADTSHDHQSDPVLILRRPDEFFARVGSGGLIGFGESYLTGAWDSPDLDRLLTVLARDLTTLVPAWMQSMRRAYVARHPRRHRNSTENTRDNIAHHYDLSNDLFRAFLDETMTYSSALFADDTEQVGTTPRASRAVPPGVPDRTQLADAQARKIERLLDLTGVGDGTDVLEIGTGWGELAIRAARRGARVRSITLSAEQRALAIARIAAAGMADRVAVELTDYRDVTGEFDAVLSVEMIEAVGHEFLPSYFGTIDRVLRPGGRAGIQAITMAHDRVLTTLGTYTWINKYIFPGGFLPSIRLIEETLAVHTTMRLAERMEFGPHYAETLRLWDEAFGATDTRALSFDSTFDRMWHFYLSYCRAGFATGYIDVQQLLLTKRAP